MDRPAGRSNFMDQLTFTAVTAQLPCDPVLAGSPVCYSSFF
ncbi:MAG: hypothetical protein ABSE07_03305 [Methanoregula sp.]